MIDKLDMLSTNGVAQNIQKIAQLFPHCITETVNGLAIDFDLLKQELSSELIDGIKERYRLEWPGKREAIVTANLPTANTLRPAPEESVDFDHTQNLYIEGDNLEVLKLLQESYLGKIKMIYIDPPYNTGKDFVYKDNFTQDTAEYQTQAGLRDDQNNRLVANPDTSGRYHSDWLSMMYPRLKLARNLLTDDGVIFISIDDNEVHNLRKICDEIFGEGNFIVNFIWEKGKEGGNDSSILRNHHEYVMLITKNNLNDYIINLDKKNLSRHIKVLPENNHVKGIENNINEGEYFQLINLSKQKDYSVKIPLLNGDIIEWPSYAPQKSIDDWIKIGKVFVGSKRVPYIKSFLKDEIQGQKPSNLLKQLFGTTKSGSIEIRNIFGDREFFSYPKPSTLIRRLIEIGSNSDSLILDFFSGSATTAHAVMQLNAEDGGKRRYIMVQLPEQLQPNTEAHKAGYATICDIGKERIRRAAQKIKTEKVEKAKKEGLFAHNYVDNQDYGFRVFKLDTSNMEDVFYKPKDINQDQLNLFADNLKPDRTAQDLVTQIMLDWGLPLSLPIAKTTIAGKEVFKVNDDALFACFDDQIDETFAKEVATYKPLRIVFRDRSFRDDTAKENVKQLLHQLTPDTEMKVL